MSKSEKEVCLKFFEKIKSEIQCIESIERLQKTRNDLFLIQTKNKNFIAKIYISEDYNYVEELIYSRLKNSPYIKKIHSSGILEDKKYVITEFYEGKTLLEKVNQAAHDLDLHYTIVQLQNFIRMCMNIKVSRFGRIKKNGLGESSTWLEWLFTYLNQLEERTQKLKLEDSKFIGQQLVLLKNFFESYSFYFDNLEPRLIPVDLNLSNFLIAESRNLLMLDLESFWHADPLLAYGDWIGNTFLTPLYDSFIHHWGTLTSQETQIVHGYALLSNTSALVFMSERNQNIFEASPWGNTSKYIDLIPYHVKAIAKIKKLPEFMSHLSIRNLAPDSF